MKGRARERGKRKHGRKRRVSGMNYSPVVEELPAGFCKRGADMRRAIKKQRMKRRVGLSSSGECEFARARDRQFRFLLLADDSLSSELR